MEQQYVAMMVLGGAGLIAALILYVVAKRFEVEEDERTGEIEAILPGANCGACGRKGCRDFAAECSRRGTLEGMHCPGAGAEGMRRIAAVLGIEVGIGSREKAFVRCNGGRCHRRVGRNAVTVASCVSAKSLAMPEGYCTYGCLGCGDCVSACRFGAMAMDSESGMPAIDLSRCVGCGACAQACPQNLIFVRGVDAGRSPVAVVVRCSNRDKGGVARKMCAVACIGCGKCARECSNGAISVEGNLAVIDPSRCNGCGKCAEVCPMQAIAMFDTGERQADHGAEKEKYKERGTTENT